MHIHILRCCSMTDHYHRFSSFTLPVASNSLLSHCSPDTRRLVPGHQHTAVFVEGLLTDMWGRGFLGAGDVYLSGGFAFYTALFQDRYHSHTDCLS